MNGLLGNLLETMKQQRISEVKLSYKTKIPKTEKVQIKNSADSYKLFINHWDNGEIEHKESLKVLLLNQTNTVLGIYNASEGGITDVSYDVRVILQAALLSNATSFVLAHNHPSGNPTPSAHDKSFTEIIKKAGMYLSILLRDHIIVCKGKYFSFAEKGIL